MRISTQIYSFALFLAILLTASMVQSQIDRSGSEAPAPQAVDRGAFYLAVGERYRVPAAEVRHLIDGGLPPAEAVVLYFIAEQAIRAPAEILSARRSGQSWRDIAMASQLQPGLFYYPLPNSARGPFVNVYALFLQQPRSEWSWESLPLDDSDVEELVSLRFVAELAGPQAPDAVRLRVEGADLPTVHHFLLSGQRTASVAAGVAAAAVRS